MTHITRSFYKKNAPLALLLASGLCSSRFTNTSSITSTKGFRIPRHMALLTQRILLLSLYTSGALVFPPIRPNRRLICCQEGYLLLTLFLFMLEKVDVLRHCCDVVTCSPSPLTTRALLLQSVYAPLLLDAALVQ